MKGEGAEEKTLKAKMSKITKSAIVRKSHTTPRGGERIRKCALPLSLLLVQIDMHETAEVEQKIEEE